MTLLSHEIPWAWLGLEEWSRRDRSRSHLLSDLIRNNGGVIIKKVGPISVSLVLSEETR